MPPVISVSLKECNCKLLITSDASALVALAPSVPTCQIFHFGGPFGTARQCFPFGQNRSFGHVCPYRSTKDDPKCGGHSAVQHWSSFP